MYSEGISQAHGRQARGVNPGCYTARGFAEPLKVPAEAVPWEWTQQHSTKGRHCTQVSGEQKGVFGAGGERVEALNLLHQRHLRGCCRSPRKGRGRGRRGESPTSPRLPAPGSTSQPSPSPPSKSHPLLPPDVVPADKICSSSGCTQMRIPQSPMLSKCCDQEEVCIADILTISSCLCIRGVSSLHLNKTLSTAAVRFLWEDGESSYNSMYTDFECDRNPILNRKGIIYKPAIFLKYTIFMGLIHSNVSSQSTARHLSMEAVFPKHTFSSDSSAALGITCNRCTTHFSALPSPYFKTCLYKLLNCLLQHILVSLVAAFLEKKGGASASI